MATIPYWFCESGRCNRFLFFQGHVYLVFFVFFMFSLNDLFLPNHTDFPCDETETHRARDFFLLQRATVRTWFYAIAPSVRTCSMAVIPSQMTQMHVKPYVRRSVRMGGFLERLEWFLGWWCSRSWLGFGVSCLHATLWFFPFWVMFFFLRKETGSGISTSSFWPHAKIDGKLR